jgi:hypothetical protein
VYFAFARNDEAVTLVESKGGVPLQTLEANREISTFGIAQNWPKNLGAYSLVLMLRRHIELTDTNVVRRFVNGDGANCGAVSNNSKEALRTPPLGVRDSLI